MGKIDQNDDIFNYAAQLVTALSDRGDGLAELNNFYAQLQICKTRYNMNENQVFQELGSIISGFCAYQENINRMVWQRDIR